MIVNWPSRTDFNRTLELFPSDILTSQNRRTPIADGDLYTLHTGIMRVDIRIPDEDLIEFKEPVTLRVG